jgi:alpha-tubulin suppressor-like RCC1 family protein
MRLPIRRIALGLAAAAIGLVACSDVTVPPDDPPRPVITSLGPPMVAAGGAAFTLIVTGQHFLEGSRVRWDGEDRPTTFMSVSALHAEILSADIASAGTAQVTVLNPAGEGGESAGRSLEVVTATLVPASTGSTLSAGSGHSCGVGGDGVVYCWGGWHYPGQPTPIAMLSAPGFQLVSAAVKSHSDRESSGCALDGDGRAYCWGWPLSHQEDPAAVPGGLVFADLAAGDEHACGVTTNGRVYCWGNGYAGQLGDGRDGMEEGHGSDEPAAIHSELSFVAVTAGTYHSCALTSAGLVYCWGSTGRGALGNGQTRPAGADPDVRPPVAVLGGHTFAVLTAGTHHTCGLTILGRAYCWGNNETGQLGNGAWGYSSSRSTPVPVAHGQYTHISAGAEHTCAVHVDGRVSCWGSNHVGQLGTGAATEIQATPVPVTGGGRFVEVSAGRRHSCALTADGAGHCWGYRGFGALGTGATIYRPGPVPTADAPSAVAIRAGIRFHCALAQDGSAWCWGRNNDGYRDAGQLGTGSFDGPQWCLEDADWNRQVPCSTRPVRVAAGGMTFVALTTGASHACALTDSGAAYCWGSNSEGQLGDGTTTPRSSPTPVAGDLVFAALAAGHASACGLTPFGAAYCWGSNGFGQLGQGDTRGRLTPVPVAFDRHFTALAGGGLHMCGVDDAGVVHCWGSSVGGQLGSATSETCTFTRSLRPYPEIFHLPCSTTPLRVGTDLFFARVEAGSAHTCAIQADGTAHCWGLNEYGQLGSVSTEMCDVPYLYRTVPCSGMPVPVTGGHRFASISAGIDHSCGIATTGDAYCWGLPNLGALGGAIDPDRSSWTPTPTPVPVTGGLRFTALASGNQHTCGLDAGGAVHCWGAAESGQVGDAQLTYDPQPMAVTGVVFAQPPGR